MKIIVYGIGRGLQLVEDSLKSKHQIIAYSDSFLKLSVFHGKPFYSIHELKKASEDADYIVLSIFDKKTSLEVKGKLCNEYGISNRIVIPFYVCLYKESWQPHLYWMTKGNKKGVILGNSVAYHGICTEYLGAGFENFALPCQDIYFNYSTLKRIIESGIKFDYLWIDLFDYNYLNIDISQTKKEFRHYISMGGIREEHNFFRNRAFSLSFKDWLREEFGIEDDTYMNEIVQELFEDNMECIKKKSDGELFGRITGEPSLPGSYMGNSLQKKRTDTIEENKEILHKMIKLAKEYRSDSKIVLTLLPVHITATKARSLICDMLWIEEFNETVHDISQKFGCLFLNYKNCEIISDNDTFFFDVHHMNKIGSRCMTSIIDNDLRKRGIY